MECRTDALIDSFKWRIARNLKLMLSMMRTLMAASSAESSKAYKQLFVNDKWIARRASPAPSAFDECACSVAYNCPNSMWSAGLITCYNGENCTIGGIVLACTAIEMILTTDYRCFFDQACINMHLFTYNYDMSKRLPLPAATLAISAMNSSIPSRFLSTDTMGTMVDQLFLEVWEIRANFVGYYEACAPASCTYTISQQLDIVYVFTTVLGFCGGLVIILRLIVPRSVQLIHLMIIYRRNQNLNIDGTEVVKPTDKS